MKMGFKSIHVLQALLFVPSILLTILVLSPLRTQADRRAEIVKDRIISRLEDSLGVKVGYERVSPALLSRVLVSGLHVTFEQGDFRAETVQIHYNPLRVLTSDDLLRHISKVVVRNGHLNLSVLSNSSREKAVGDKEIIDIWSLLAHKSVEFSGLSAEVYLNQTIRLNANNVELTLNDERGIVRYEIAGVFRAEDIDFLNRELRVVTLSNGSFSPDESTVNGRFDILSAVSNHVVLQPISVDFTYADNELAARRVGDDIPINLLIDYSSDGWRISGETKELNITDIALPGISSGWLTPYFSSIVDGQFQFSGSSFFDEFVYEADMSLWSNSDIETHDYRTELKIRGSQSNVYINKLRISFEWGSLSYVGTLDIERLAPDGSLTFSLDESLLGYPAFAAFNLDTRAGVITAEPEILETNDARFRDFRFLAIRENDSFVVSLIAVPESEENTQEKKLTIDLFVNSRAELAIHGFVNVKGFESSFITRLIGLTGPFDPPLIKDFLFDMSASFVRNNKTWTASLNEVALRHKDNLSNGFTISGRASPENWSLDSLRVTWNEYVVDGRGFGNKFAEEGFAEGRVLLGEQIFPITAQWFDDGSLVVNSDFGLSAYMEPKSTYERLVQFVGESVSIPLPEGRIVTSIDVRGPIITRGNWELYINRAQFLLTERSEKPDIAVEFNGKLSRDSVIISEISISDAYSELTGNAIFKIANNSQVLLGQLLLDGAGDENYQITLNKDGDFWAVSLDISAARIERIMPGRFSGELFVDGSLNGTLKNPSISLTLNSNNGIFDGQPFEVQGAISVESEFMRINDIRCRYNGISLNRGLVLLDMKEGSLKSTVELDVTYNQVPVSSGFSLAVDFGKSFRIAEILCLLDSSYKGTIATQPIMWNSTPHLPAYTFHFSKDDAFFRIVSPGSEMLNLSYSYGSGELVVLSGSKMPVIARGNGTIKDGDINFSFSELSMDPALINYVMYRDPILLQYYVIFQSGRFVGKLDVTGPLNNPEIDGILRAVDLKVDTPYTYAEIQPASTDIHFEGHRITIDRLHIPVGDGILYGGGFVVLDRFRIVDFDMFYGATPTSGGVGVPVYYPLLGVNLDGIFTGEVHMTGGDKRFYLDGDFTFHKLRVSLDTSGTPIRQIRKEAYSATVSLDFDFITGNNCIVYLPNEQLRIIRATAETGQIVNLVYSNKPYTFSFTGVLPIKTGDIFYFDRDFRITEGSLSFNETSEKFNPTLAFRAETRVKDEKSEDVQVALVYNAPIMSDFNPTIETVPPRSDILSLFGQAVAPYANSQDNRGASRMLLAASGIFGQMGIVQPFEKALQERFNLDMVSIQTDIIENTLTEGLTRGTDTGLGTQSRSLGRYLDNTSMYVGKYIGTSLFFSGTLTANFLEDQRTSSIIGSLEFQTSVDLEMSTPFFNALWSYSPNPDEGFVAGNAITLKWHFSY